MCDSVRRDVWGTNKDFNTLPTFICAAATGPDRQTTLKEEKSSDNFLSIQLPPNEWLLCYRVQAEFGNNGVSMFVIFD